MAATSSDAFQPMRARVAVLKNLDQVAKERAEDDVIIASLHPLMLRDSTPIGVSQQLPNRAPSECCFFPVSRRFMPAALPFDARFTPISRREPLTDKS